ILTRWALAPKGASSLVGKSAMSGIISLRGSCPELNSQLLKNRQSAKALYESSLVKFLLPKTTNNQIS
ncbi:MAG: hypothetical protein LHW64_11625, partial [Candidatus Cloacimonetes bacterium]|nr:hypothetical protein [Candidatus Cloacimonadota bacterium]MDY0230734.1 hypothetical protein [Candidatus Cloacimonadaceae bacterium]